LDALAEGLFATAQARASVYKTDIKEAISLLFKDFREPPRELSLEDIQLAIDFLTIPENATNFINLNSIPKSDEIRDR
jgi:hypothetical protein